jgi:hypothetical protein
MGSRFFHPSVFLSAIILVLLVVGCGGDDGTAPTGGGGGGDGTTVGPAGGTVASEDQQAQVVIPAGALAADTEITIDPASGYPAGPLAGTVYDFGPDGLQFESAVQLKIAYDPALVPDGSSQAKLRLASLSGDLWLQNPGSAADSVAHLVSGSVTHFSTWGVVTDSGDGVRDSTAVYVLDSPPDDDPTAFATLAAALAYLIAELDQEDIGRVILQTSAVQTVESLAFPFFLQLVADDGVSPTLAGPGSAPLVIDAAGAFALQGFTVINSGGLLINANRNLDVQGNTLPAGTAVSIGGVKSAAFPAGDAAYKGRESREGSSGGAHFAGNTFGGNLDWYFNAAVNNAYSYNVINNTGTGIAAAGTGTLSGGATLRFGANEVQNLYVRTAFGLESRLEVMNHDSNPEFEVDSPVEGATTWDVRNNLFTSAAIGGEGIGEIELFLRTNDLGSGRINVGVGNIRIDSMNQTANTLLVGGIHAIQDLVFEWSSTDDSIEDAFTVDLYDNFENTAVNMYFSNLFAGGNLGFGFSGATEIELSDNCRLGAEFRAHIDKDVLHLRVFDATFYGKAYLEVDDWRAGVMVQGVGVGYQDELHVNFPRAAFAFLEFGEGASFSGGKPIYVGDFNRDKWSLPGWRAPAGARSPLHDREEAAINFNGANMTFSGSSHLYIFKTDAPVTVDGCVISQGGGPVAVNIAECSGAITINDNNFTGAGLGVTDCDGSISITDNTMELGSAGGGGIGLGGCASATVTGNTVNCSSASGYAFSAGEMSGTVTLTGNNLNAGQATQCLMIASSRVYADDNPTLSGNINIVEGPVHLSGNTISSCFLLDGWPFGGLMNDPVEDNDGLDPYMVLSFIDFDGNGCCDYPPPNNAVDEHGACTVCEGVSPPGK